MNRRRQASDARKQEQAPILQTLVVTNIDLHKCQVPLKMSEYVNFPHMGKNHVGSSSFWSENEI